MSSFKVEFMSEYENKLAQAAKATTNMAASFREFLETSKVDGVAEEAVFSGASAEYIVDGWRELESNDDKEALASFKAAMARECRKLTGHGCKIVDGRLIGTKVGAGKQAKAKSDLVTSVEEFELWANETQSVEMLELIEKAKELYRAACGESLKS